MRHRIRTWLPLVAFCSIFTSEAATGDVGGWRAEWIVPPEASEANSWWCFRKTIDISEPAAKCVARIACDSKYWLWINGELVVFEGQLKRGPTPTATYYDEVDLTRHWCAGENVIAILMWHFGKEGMSHKSSGAAGLLFDATLGAQSISSDASWRVTRHPAYVGTAKPHPNWRLPESNIGYDARKELGDWQAADFDDRDWPTARPQGKPPATPWNELVRRPIPAWRDFGRHEYEDAAELPAVSDGEPIVAKLPYNAQVTPYLEIEAQAGLTIDIRTDNYRGGSEPNVRAEYTTRGGRQQYESLGWLNGHEVIYTIPAGVKIRSLKYRETGYDARFAGSFQCDDERLNTLWQKSQRTLHVNMRDTYFDCPGRERAQWWGDVTLELQQAFYGLDRRSDQLSRKAVLELAAWQRPTGELHSPIPSGNYDQELPMQMLASIGRYGFWEYYRHTGDKKTIAQVYPAVKRYLALWRLGDEGHVIPRKGDWTWGDWGQNKDLPLLYDVWCYLALDGAGRMAKLLGDESTSENCDAKQQRIKEAFNRDFWTGIGTGRGYRSPGHQGPTDDRGQALAVLAGIAGEDKYPAIIDVFKTERHASPYMEKYVLEALIQMGEMEFAQQRMRERYAKMIDSPLTTLWEGWGIGSAGYGGGSYNHAWSGGPLTLMSQYMAGVDPLEPGYTRYRVAPQLGSLMSVRAKVASPIGEIVVAVSQQEKRKQIELRAPKGATAELVLPAQSQHEILVGKEKLPQKRPNGFAFSGGRVLTTTDSAITLELQPGEHAITVSPAAGQ